MLEIIVRNTRRWKECCC